MSFKRRPGAVGGLLLQLEHGAGQPDGGVGGVAFHQLHVTHHGAFRVLGRERNGVVWRRRGDGELHRRCLQLVAARSRELHKAILAQQQARNRKRAVETRRQTFGARHRRPRVVGLHLLQLEHGVRQHDGGVVGIHLREHDLAIPHLHAARDDGEMRAARGRLGR